jgi:hypothetical protein
VTTVRVTTAAELLSALAAADEIEVDGSLSGMPMITLRPGVSLRGGTLRFGAKGIRLSADNTLEDVTVRTGRTASASTPRRAHSRCGTGQPDPLSASLPASTACPPGRLEWEWGGDIPSGRRRLKPLTSPPNWTARSASSGPRSGEARCLRSR